MSPSFRAPLRAFAQGRCAHSETRWSPLTVSTPKSWECVNDPWANKAFAEANKLGFSLLSDYARETVRKYNVFHNDFGGLKGYTAAKRSVFILDEGGTVRYKWVSEDPGKEPNYEEIKSVLSKM